MRTVQGTEPRIVREADRMTEQAGFKVALYARVSTDDKGQDPYNQMDIIRPIAERRGYEIVGEYVDYASGRDQNRPQWKEVMELARTHRIDGIMALRVDRVMRSVQHLCAVIDDLKDWRVRLIFSDMDFDPKSPNSMLTINILSSIAQWEKEIYSARTKEGLARKKQMGVKLGRRYREDIPMHKIAFMRAKGMGWNAIQDAVGIPKSTLRDRRQAIDAIADELRATTPIAIAEGYALHPRSSDSPPADCSALFGDDAPPEIDTSADADPGDSAAHDIAE